MDTKETRRIAIENILLNYVSIGSFTNSCEIKVKAFFEKWFSKVEYFKHHPENCGFYPVKDDYLNRVVPWCLLKGEGSKTVVLIHHCDVVDTLDFGRLRSLALSPHELTKAFSNGEIELPFEAKKDLESGDWLFGRGVGDMKGGASIQLALIEEYSKQSSFQGNIVLISVPDEENLSAGMTSAVVLLKELKDRHSLEYTAMINCEPHDRDDENRPVIYHGSIGKLLPVFFVRGKLAHVGHVFDGFSPINLLAEIIRKTELNSEFIERVGNTTSPPPAYLAAKDRKPVYDVSLPLTASGCLSVLPLKRTAPDILGRLKEIAFNAFDAIIADMKFSHEKYCGKAEIKCESLPWKSRVLLYSELFVEAKRDSGDEFLKAHDLLMDDLKKKFRLNEITAVDCANVIIEKTLAFVKDLSPVVVIALAPPYYPSAHNGILAEKAEHVNRVESAVKQQSELLFDQKMDSKDYFVAISDLSYAHFTGDSDTIDFIEKNMLMWNDVYYIPLEIIKEISMPVLNIGPWGKDLHKYIERVYLPDLFYRTPELLNFAINKLLEH